MTHTNHRQGTVESLSKDYVIFVYAARGINNNGAGPKCQEFLHMAFKHKPVNAGSPQVGNLFTASANELIEGVGGQTKAYAVFDTKKKAEALVKDITAADLGLSVIVSGLFNEVESICGTTGIKRHTSQCSLGVWGKTEKLPQEEVMDITTMCGHGMVSSNLVRKLAADVKPADNVFKWKDLIKKYSPQPPRVEITFDDTAMYQYTGGTTGVSKGVILTHGNLSKQVQQIESWFPTFKKGEEIMMAALPFFHVFGLSVAMNFSIHMGWGDVLVPKPQPEPLLETIIKFKPTFAPLVPTMYIGILNHPDIHKTDLTSIKGCFSGSAPLPIEVIKEFEEKTGAVIVEGYGLTETSPVAHINPFSGGKRKVGSIGLPAKHPDPGIKFSEIKITDDDGNELPPGETGEITVRSPVMIESYFEDQERTQEAIRNGWFHTGDLGYKDDDGYFFFVDRKKDIIRRKGENICNVL